MAVKRCRGEQGDDNQGAADSDYTIEILSNMESHNQSSGHRKFECKTCNRQFQSFQALGGHRASHKRAQSAADEHHERATSPSQPKTHECSICGTEFAMGQALGGHMRRHRAELEAAGTTGPSSKKQKRVSLDLNLAPPGVEHIKMGDFLGLGFVGKVPLVC